MRPWPALALCSGLMLGPPCANAQDKAVEDHVPAALVGIWYWEPDCPDNRVMRLEFYPQLARANGMDGKCSCTYAGQRALTPTRWYLDLECVDGRRIHLDINALDDGRLLIAHRPLGVACFYGRPGR